MLGISYSSAVDGAPASLWVGMNTFGVQLKIQHTTFFLVNVCNNL